MSLGGFEIPTWLPSYMLLSMLWIFLTVLVFGNRYGMRATFILFPSRKSIIAYCLMGFGGLIALFPVVIWINGGA